MYHPTLLSKMAQDHHEALLEVTIRERMLREMPTYKRSRRTQWISLAASAPIVFLILWLTVLA